MKKGVSPAVAAVIIGVILVCIAGAVFMAYFLFFRKNPIYNLDFPDIIGKDAGALHTASHAARPHYFTYKGALWKAMEHNLNLD